LKYAGKPIPRSARSGLSGKIKVPNQKNQEPQDIKKNSLKTGTEKVGKEV
jgi:hypothetical protein